MLLNHQITGSGKPIVFLHGMAGSRRYWDGVIEQLDPKAYQAIAIDLLGFGNSPMPRRSAYDYEAHIDSILETLEHVGVGKPYAVVAHSMGALLALRLAAERPEQVSRLVLCGLPFYPTPAIAKRAITNSKKRLELAYYGPTSRALCTLWCKWLRPLTKHLAPLYLAGQPKLVAQDSLLHTWQSYDKSRHHVIESQTVPADLAKLKVPAVFLYGSEDGALEYVKSNNLLQGSTIAKLEVIQGLSHNLPIEQPESVLEYL